LTARINIAIRSTVLSTSGAADRKNAAQEQADRDSGLEKAAMAATASNDRVMQRLDRLEEFLDVARLALGSRPILPDDDDEPE
jgi:hypothetical protein